MKDDSYLEIVRYLKASKAARKESLRELSQSERSGGRQHSSGGALSLLATVQDEERAMSHSRADQGGSVQLRRSPPPLPHQREGVALGTLTVQGIPWTYRRYNGKGGFEYGAHAIHFIPSTGFFHLKEKGETVFTARTSHECLAEAAGIVWDYCAAQIVPSWES